MTDPKPARHPAAMLMQVRTWHACIGMLIAPTVIFMAATGIAQIYNLHEAHGGYTPPAILEKLSRVHKDQVFALDQHGPPKAKPAPPAKTAAAPAPAEHPAKLATTLLKAFLTAVALGLIASTCLGLWMALRQGQGRRRLYAFLLVIGAAIPIVLVALSG